MPVECTLRNKRGQYRDKVEWITYQIPNVHTEEENGGKRHVRSERIARAFARDAMRMRCGCDAKRWRPRRTREKGRAEENKRARVYIHVYVRGKPGREVSEGRAVATSGK